MKAPPFPVVFTIALIGALLLPTGTARSDSTDVHHMAARGVVLAGDAESAVPCRLFVEADRQTEVDRGVLVGLESGQFFVGSFRYWNEPAGRMLYVYDDVGNLVGRVVNPASVVLLGIDEETH